MPNTTSGLTATIAAPAQRTTLHTAHWQLTPHPPSVPSRVLLTPSVPAAPLCTQLPVPPPTTPTSPVTRPILTHMSCVIRAHTASRYPPIRSSLLSGRHGLVFSACSGLLKRTRFYCKYAIVMTMILTIKHCTLRIFNSCHLDVIVVGYLVKSCVSMCHPNLPICDSLHVFWGENLSAKEGIPQRCSVD